MDNAITPQDAARLAVSILGGPVNAARLLGLPRYQTVQSWLRNQIPAEHCPAIERETRAIGRPVRCEALRPDVDWVVLRRHPGLSAFAPLNEGATA